MAREVIDLLTSPTQDGVIELLTSSQSSRRQGEVVGAGEPRRQTLCFTESLLSSAEPDFRVESSSPLVERVAKAPDQAEAEPEPAPKLRPLSSSPPRQSNFNFGLASSSSPPMRKRASSPVSPVRPHKRTTKSDTAKITKPKTAKATTKATIKATTKAPKPPKLSKINRDRNETVKELKLTISGTVHDLTSLLEESNVSATSGTLSLEEGVTAVISLERTTTSHWDEAMRAYVEGLAHTVAEPLKIIVLDGVATPIFEHSEPTLEQLDAVYGSECIYIVEGFGKLLKNQVNAYNRMLQKRTRNAIKDIETPVETVPAPDPSGFMQKQVHLQVVHGRRLVYCEKPAETTAWIMDLLKEISVNRYLNKAFVNINTGDVKSQKDPKLVRVEALCQLPRATKRMAQSLEEQFASLGDMVANSRGKSLALSANLRAMLDRFVESRNPDEII